jgi:hypothetical protein
VAFFLFAVPILGAAVWETATRQPWWRPAALGVVVAYAILELLLDYVPRVLGWRKTWIIAPYLVLFYGSLLGMIGYCFAASKRYGFVTLATYFAQLGAMLYAIKRGTLH